MTTEKETTTNDAPPQTAMVPTPPAAPPSPDSRRVTVEQLATLPDSDRRNNWISALVDAEVARQNYAQDRALAREFAISGQFDDLKNMTAEQAVATAMVKIQLGRAWGFNAADSMRYIFFTNGKPSIENEIVAAKLQQAGYAWDVQWLQEDIQHKGRPAKKTVGCRLWLKRWDGSKYADLVDRDGAKVSVEFGQYEADTAKIWEKGKQISLSEKFNYQYWAADMFYWRCIARVKKYHAPAVLRGGGVREEALDVVPIDQLPPDQLPRELQPPAPPSETPARPSLRDRVIQHEGFKEPSPGPEEPPTTAT